MAWRICSASIVVTIVLCSSAHASPVFSRSAFEGVPTTYVDFETRGDGTPFNLNEGEVAPLDRNQFGHLGFAVDAPDPLIGNDPDPTVEAVLSLVGSLEHAIFLMGGSGSEVGFAFAGFQIRSVGISVIRNTSFLTGDLVALIYTQAGPGQPVSILEHAVYDSSFLQGQSGNIDYGFIGFTTDQPIIGFVFDFANQDDNYILYDDLVFSTQTVPAPSCGLVISLGVLARSRRKRELL